MEDLFKITWENMLPENKEGLFRELYSTPIDITDDKYHTLDLESKHYRTYINVGIWRTLQDFDDAIGNFIPGRDSHPKDPQKELISLYKFEYKLRERLVMQVDLIREGAWILPQSDL